MKNELIILASKLITGSSVSYSNQPDFVTNTVGGFTRAATWIVTILDSFVIFACLICIVKMIFATVIGDPQGKTKAKNDFASNLIYVALAGMVTALVALAKSFGV